MISLILLYSEELLSKKKDRSNILRGSEKKEQWPPNMHNLTLPAIIQNEIELSAVRPFRNEKVLFWSNEQAANTT